MTDPFAPPLPDPAAPPSTRPATRVLAALGEEASGVAHDFDNALTAIVAHATLLFQSPDPDTRHRAEAILKACRVGRQVVERVRRSVRPGEAPWVRVDLAELVTEALAVAEVRAQSRAVHLSHSLGAAHLAAEPAELQQALMNVVHNAIDAARHAVHLEVQVAGHRVTIDVQDDGPGVPEPIRDAIFEPWVSTRGEAGTGLGLPQARRVARSLGGDLILATTSATGTTFRFELPLATDPRLAAPRPLTGFDVAALATPISALVVDDDAGTREALAELLELSGFRVLQASAPSEALSILSTHPPLGLLLTDLELGPRLAPPESPSHGSPAAGLTLIRRAAALDPTLPILVVSGAHPDTLPPALRRLVAGHLTKPCSPARLIEHAQRLARLDHPHLTDLTLEPR